MYNNKIYPVNYPADVFNNQAPNYDFYGMPPEQHYPMPPENHYPQPMPPEHHYPCPEYPPMPPMPPVNPMPPIDLMPGYKMQCMMHLKHILENAMNKKVALVVEGAKGNFDCTKIISVNDCTVTVATKNGICIIPLKEITAICMSKEVAKDVMENVMMEED